MLYASGIIEKRGYMGTPIIARQLGSTNHIWLGTFVFIAASVAPLLFTAPKAHAEGLLPEIASVELPLGGTILDPVLTPVTDLTNDLLPVDINPGSDSVGATVAPPIISKAEQPLLSVSVPVQPIVRNLAQPLAQRRAIAPTPQPAAQPNLTPVSTAESTIVLASATRIANNVQSLRVIGMTPTAASLQSNNDIFALLPEGWRTSVRTILGKPDFAPSIISLAILLTVIAMISNILYVSRSNGLTWSGNSRLAKLSQRVDLTQLSVLSVSVIGTVAVIIVLLVAKV